MIDLLGFPGQESEGGATNDIAYRWIQVLFDTGPNSGFGAAFQTFTSMLGLLGALFIGWHIISGIVSSATSGKVLGDKYHQVWAPLRVVVGFGLMIPLAGGFSTVHYLLKDVVGRAAVNMGNAPIVSYIEHLANFGGSVVVPSMAGQSLVNDILNRELCVAVRNEMYSLARSGAYGRTYTHAEMKSTPQTGIAEMDYAYCGKVRFVTPLNAENGVSGNNDADVELRKAALVDFGNARAEATKNMVSKIREHFNLSVNGTSQCSNGSGSNCYSPISDYVSKNFHETKPTGEMVKAMAEAGLFKPNTGAFLRETAQEWNTIVGNAATEVYKNISEESKTELAERIKKYGFMMAGSYERDISKISALTSALSNGTPAKTKPDPGSSYMGPYLAAYNAVLASKSLNTSLNDNGEGHILTFEENADESSILSSVFSFLDIENLQKDKQDVSNSTGDPIGHKITLGHTYITIAVGGILGLAAIHGGIAAWDGSILGKGASLAGGGFFAAAFGYLSQWATYAIMILLIVGVLYAYVLPMIPMIMVFIMGVNWLVMFLEAAIAGVLWAFAFIRMDGQDFFDRGQSPGVSLLFNLFMRPAIGMLAFIGGLIILPQMLLTLDVVWGEAFVKQTSGGFTAPLVGWLVSLIMGAWFQWHLSLRIFGLIPTIADRVGHWMGLNSGGGYNDSNETASATGAMVGAGMAMARAPISPNMAGKMPGGNKGKPNVNPSGDDSKDGSNLKIDIPVEKK